MPAPLGALPTDVVRRSEMREMVMSVTTQIIFPYMSDARAPAMDVHMAPQELRCQEHGHGVARSFCLNLSALLIEDNG